MNEFLAASRRAALLASTAIACTAMVASAVRVLPWLLDPAVPWRVAAPFARGLASIAIEAALLVGWPVGWTFACFRLVETGEARVLQTLGERPLSTVSRLGAQGGSFAVALALIALAYGRDASAPGRVATELVSQARSACRSVPSPRTYSVPFTAFTWLCAPGREPRLLGSVPGPLSRATLSARDARIAGDFRSVEFDDARVAIAGSSPVDLHVGSLVVRGMPPWAQASNLPPVARALMLAATGWMAACAGAYAALRGAIRSRIGVLAVGSAGPLAALGLLRIYERAGTAAWTFASVPIAGSALAFAFAIAAQRLGRLRDPNHAASTRTRV